MSSHTSSSDYSITSSLGDDTDSDVAAAAAAATNKRTVSTVLGRSNNETATTTTIEARFRVKDLKKRYELIDLVKETNKGLKKTTTISETYQYCNTFRLI